MRWAKVVGAYVVIAPGDTARPTGLVDTYPSWFTAPAEMCLAFAVTFVFAVASINTAPGRAHVARPVPPQTGQSRPAT